MEMKFVFEMFLFRENQQLKEKLATVVKETEQLKATSEKLKSSNDKLKNSEKQNATILTEITTNYEKKIKNLQELLVEKEFEISNLKNSFDTEAQNLKSEITKLGKLNDSLQGLRKIFLNQLYKFLMS